MTAKWPRTPRDCRQPQAGSVSAKEDSPATSMATAGISPAPEQLRIHVPGASATQQQLSQESVRSGGAKVNREFALG